MKEIKVDSEIFKEAINTIKSIGQEIESNHKKILIVNKALEDTWDGKSGKEFLQSSTKNSNNLKSMATGIDTLAQQIDSIDKSYKEADLYAARQINM